MEPSEVLLFYPNLIGYLRIIFMILSFYFSKYNWSLAIFFYGFAFFGDVVDGHVARAFNQSSEFGGILDMVTDRLMLLIFDSNFLLYLYCLFKKGFYLWFIGCTIAAIP